MQIVVGLLTTRQGERMKRSILFFTIAVLAISFSACGDDALPEGLVIPGTSSEAALSSGASVSSGAAVSSSQSGSVASSGGAFSSVSTGTSLPTGVTFVETFDNATTAMYASGTTSANAKGIVWSWGNGRTDLTLNGKALCGPKNDASTDLTATLPAGVGSIGFKFKYGYDAGTIGVKINGTLVATSPAATSSEQIFSVTVNSMGSTVVALVINKRVIIDDITWTDGAPPETDKPTASVTAPTEGQTVTGYSATISGTAADSGTGASGVKEVWVKLDGSTAVKASGTTSWSWLSGELAAGSHSVEVYAVDNAGNVSLTNTRIFSLAWPYDVTPPTVEFTEFAGSAIGGTAADNLGLITNVKVSLDNVNWYNATGTTRWSYTFSGLSTGGSYTLYAKAYDKAGNVTNPVKTYSYTKTTAWTVMVYLCADNNLESSGLEDFNEMEKGIADAIAAGNGAIVDNLNVIVLIDRAVDSSDGGDTAAPTESGGSDWTDTRLYRIKSDTSTSYFGSERLDDGGSGAGHIANLGEKMMDDPATLSWFMGYSKANFPAQNYALILWNHGGGSRSVHRAVRGVRPTREVCWDDASGSWEPLYIDEIQQAVGNHFSSGNKLGVIGFDACLMGMVETAYEYRNLASYMVGSMQSEQGDGWNYTDWISSIGDASLTPNQLAKVWVESYERFIEAGGGSGDGETLAATDLSAMETLKTRIDALAAALYAENKKTAIEAVRDASVNYVGDSPEYTPFFDLYDFCNRLYSDSANGFSANLKNAAQAVIDQLGVAIIRCYGESGNGQSYYFAEDSAAKRGLSIFFTKSSTDWSNQGWYTTDDHSTESATGNLIYGNMDFPTASGSGVNTWRDLMDAWY